MQLNTVEIYIGQELKIVSSQEYRELRLREILSNEARLLLDWLKKRKKKIITLVEICKAGPVDLRQANIARQTLIQLSRLGFADKQESGAIYSGSYRKESWEFLENV